MGDNVDNDEKFSRIDSKLDKISDDVNEIKVTMATNTESLKYHVKRTNLLEESLTALRKDLEPIQKHVTMLEGVLKFFGIISLFVGIAIGIAKLFPLIF